MLQNIEWIFFDLGSTLIDETKADLRRIREMTEGTDITEEMFCEKRLEMIRQGLSGDPSTIAFFRLQKHPGTARMKHHTPMRNQHWLRLSTKVSSWV